MTSRNDTLVPSELPKRLARMLVDAGHQQVYLLELDQASHPGYTKDNAQDAAKYQAFLHALYKKYSLPHIPEYAQQGHEVLQASKLLL